MPDTPVMMGVYIQFVGMKRPPGINRLIVAKINIFTRTLFGEDLLATSLREHKTAMYELGTSLGYNPCSWHNLKRSGLKLELLVC